MLQSRPRLSLSDFQQAFQSLGRFRLLSAGAIFYLCNMEGRFSGEMVRDQVVHNVGVSQEALDEHQNPKQEACTQGHPKQVDPWRFVLR
jgi:hypothetical protein